METEEAVGKALEKIGEWENLDNLLRLADFLHWNDSSRLAFESLWHELYGH